MTLSPFFPGTILYPHRSLSLCSGPRTSFGGENMRLTAGLSLLLVASSVLSQNPAGQTATATSDPQALTLAAHSIAAMIGGNSVTDISITGNVTSIAGDIETGMMTLLAKGTSESRMVLSLSGGTRTETRN